MKKIAFITGATSGIGAGCARAFAVAGYNLILSGRNADRLDTIRCEAEEKGAEVITLAFDVRDRAAGHTAISTLPEEWKSIDVLINSAGGALGLEKVTEGSLDDWDEMIDTNVKALLFVTREIAPLMLKRDKGHIVNIGSTAGDGAYAGGAVYCAAKAAVKTISDGLRIDLVDTNIRITNIKPGLVETAFSVTRFHGDEEKAANVYKGIKALTGDDVAGVVLYTVSVPENIQIAEVTLMPTHQASGTVIDRKN